MTAAILAPLLFPVNFGPFPFAVLRLRSKFPEPHGENEATRSFLPRTRVRFGGERVLIQNKLKNKAQEQKPNLRHGLTYGTVTFTDFVLEKTPQPQAKQVFTR